MLKRRTHLSIFRALKHVQLTVNKREQIYNDRVADNIATTCTSKQFHSNGPRCLVPFDCSARDLVEYNLNIFRLQSKSKVIFSPLDNSSHTFSCMPLLARVRWVTQPISSLAWLASSDTYRWVSMQERDLIIIPFCRADKVVLGFIFSRISVKDK